MAEELWINHNYNSALWEEYSHTTAALSERTWRHSNQRTEERLYSATELPSVLQRKYTESHNLCPEGLFWTDGQCRCLQWTDKELSSACWQRPFARRTVTFTDWQDRGAELCCSHVTCPGPSYESHCHYSTLMVMATILKIKNCSSALPFPTSFFF